MSSELNVLARKLDRISEQHRWYRDFTLENLRDALREVIATFPVYRTYIRSDDKEADPEDRRQINIAIREAKRRNPAVNESVFDFIQSLLLLEHPEGLDDAQRAERHSVRHAVSAVDRAGDGQGRGGHRFLSLLSAGFVERSGRQTGAVRSFGERLPPEKSDPRASCGRTP